ncbi:MAG: hypothetical protein ACFE7R_09910 [Candidatus Hodarchaeota archaeon]
MAYLMYAEGGKQLNTNSLRPGKKTVIAVVVISSLVLSTLLIIQAPTGMERVRVAIYDDRGVAAISAIAMENMFNWMGAEVTVIGSSEIRNGDLENYDILAMPGGCWCDERCEILGDEMEIVRQFIADGGAYFGVDGGASYATSYRMDIFHGVLSPDANGSGDFLLEMNVNTDSTGPDLSREPESYTIFYEASGYFDAENMTGVIPICTYTDTGYPSMIAFEYENGRVFLSSPHPEFEEGSMRDGVDTYDTMTDPDSEWGFMLKISRWLIAEL